MTDIEKLEQAIAAQEALRPILGDEVVDTTLAALRQQLNTLREGLRAAGERRLVTVLFADVSGFTSISETMDAEDVSEMMNALWQRIDTLIASHGGRIDKHIGDAVMALWGADVAREDDAERAIRAALAMQVELISVRLQEQQSLNSGSAIPLKMRIGINTGMALIGALGTIGEYTAVGDTVNLASRLEESAPLDGILISHETYRQVRGIFEVQPVQPIAVKGKLEPIRVYLVLKAKPRAFRLGRRGVEGVETSMVGRYTELAHLQAALRKVETEHSMLAISLVGEAGIGKSRLLYEFQSWTDQVQAPWIFFKGRASEEAGRLPYALVRDIFSFRFGIQDSDSLSAARGKLEQGILEFLNEDPQALEKAHYIGHLIGFDFMHSPYLSGLAGDAQQIRDRAFHYLVQLFTAITRMRMGYQRVQVAIFLEDLHWADQGSLDVFTYLMETCAGLPLLIVVTTRATLFERLSWGKEITQHTRFDLQPLTKEDSLQLVDNILRKAVDVPANLRNLIVDGAEGNPFYVEELIKMLIDEKVILPGEEQWHIETQRLAEMHIPSTLAGVLQARLDGLPQIERETLQRASVIGRIFWDDAVCQLCIEDGSEAPDDVSSIGKNRGQLSDKAAKLPLPVLRRHLDTLQQRELVFRRDISTFDGTNEYLFKHAILRDVTYETVLKRLRRIYHGQAAIWLIQHSDERANEYAGLIAEHFERAGEKFQAVEWYGRAADQAQKTYAVEAALAYYQKALDLSKEEQVPYTQKTAWYDEYGELLRQRAEYDRAVEIYSAMLGLAEAEADPIGEARAHIGLSFLHENMDNHLLSLEYARKAETAARRAGAAGKIELAVALYKQGGSHYFLGKASDALRLGEQMKALCDKFGDSYDELRTRARCYNLLGTVYGMMEDYDEQILYRQRCLALFEQLGDLRYVSLMSASLSSCYMISGDYATALEVGQSGIKIAQEIGSLHSEISLTQLIAQIYVYQGQYSLAEGAIQRAFDMQKGPSGRPVRTRDFYLIRAAALLGQNKLQEAFESARQALAFARQVGIPLDIGLSLATLANCAWLLQQSQDSTAAVPVGEIPDAAACYQESLDIFVRLGRQLEQAETLMEWARYDNSIGDQARGRTNLQTARAIFQKFNLPVRVGQVDALEARLFPE